MMADEQAASEAEQGGASADEQPESSVDHIPEGLDLARTLARSLRGNPPAARRRQPRRTPPPTQSSGAHPDGRDPQTLSAAMNRLVAAKGWSTEVSVHAVLGRWPALVGPVNAQHTTPVSYHDGVLTVQTDATVWATSLRAIAPQLVAKLNQVLGEGTVTRVVIRGPDAPSWKRGRRSVRGRGPRDTYG